ncbi:tetratricopeptide repeat protein [Candidatus Parabeggiatoa sp. HSG14]|uniref:tetratricopeptide repeat protein n=1 Tax=Candidatus Parabeggiatoa sp. HSG14 TaxID=3055593 RepID=UPI0025A77424|nr:tetratricopeptide repeat protein [Thiotrichales bacterium HSG14]
MSLLMDALKKADEAKKINQETTTPPFDKTSDLSIENLEKKQNFVETTDNHVRKDTQPYFNQIAESSSTTDSLSIDWNDDLLDEFKKVDIQQETTVSDSNQIGDFSSDDLTLEEYSSPFKNDDTKIESTAHKWDDEFLPQFQSDEDESEISSPIVDDKDESEIFSPIVDDKDESEISLPMTDNKNINSINWNKESLTDDLKNNKDKPTQITHNESNESNVALDSFTPVANESNNESNSESNNTLDSFSQKAIVPFSKQTQNFSFVKDTKLDEPHTEKFKVNLTQQTKDEKHLPLEKITKNTPHPADAQRVFAAAANAGHSSKRMLWLSGILGVLVVAMAIGYYYLSQLEGSSLNFQTRKPLMTTTSTKQSISNIFEETISQPSSTSNQSSFASIKGGDEKAENEQEATENSVSKQSAEPTQEPEKMANSSIQPKRSDSLGKPLEGKKSTTQTKQAMSTSPKIRTSHKKVISPIYNELSKGYNAFQRGDDKVAERAYANALRQDKNNRDALLGLAALALRNNEVYQAQQYYQRILRAYPQDTYAQAGLINTLDNRSPANESQLKLLLDKTPKSAYLNFSLGNLYASQKRWAQAQQAYFNALQYDNKQADYAYNLAVSLDYLNQPHLALSYYQRALQLVKNKPVNFDVTAVQQRIKTLIDHTGTSALAELSAQNF